MKPSEKIIVSTVFGGVFVAIGIGLIFTTVAGFQEHRTASRPTPITQTQSVGNVHVVLNESTEPTPAVMTTEQLADEIGVNADTVRRRYSSNRLYGFKKLDRDAWVRIGHDACMFRAFGVHDADMGI